MNTEETLNLLLRTCRDGEQGFRTCADAVADGELRAALQRHADECAHAAEELKMLVARHGGGANDATSLAGDLHRGWVIAKGALTGKGARAVLAECERGEDIAVRDYRLALAQDLPDDVRQTIERQLRGVRRNHDHIKALRDEQVSARAPVPASGTMLSGQPALADRLLQWSIAQVRLHPVRSLGVLAVLGIVGWRALTPRSSGMAHWLRRLR